MVAGVAFTLVFLRGDWGDGRGPHLTVLGAVGLVALGLAALGAAGWLSVRITRD